MTSPNPESQAQPLPLLKNLVVKLVDVLVATVTDADSVGVVKFFKKMVATNLSEVTIGAIMAKNTSWKLTKTLELFLKMPLSKSIVSTELVTQIAESYGATMFNVLTGFKFIAEKIHEFEEKHNHTYMRWFEKSFGYLWLNHLREINAIQAVLVVLLNLPTTTVLGLTLADGIEEIYKEYGYYAEKKQSVTHFQVDGVQNKKAIMALNSATMLQQNGTQQLSLSEDFKRQTALMADGTVTNLTTPPSDVLKYTLADGVHIAVRPSGIQNQKSSSIAVVGGTNAKSQKKIALIEAEINAFV